MHANLVKCEFAVTLVLVDNLHGAVVVYTPFTTHYVVDARCHFVPFVVVTMSTQITMATCDQD